MVGTKRRIVGVKSGGPSPPLPSAKRERSTSSTVASSGVAADQASAATASASANNNNNSNDPRELQLSTSTNLYEYLERLPPRSLRAMYALPSPRGPIVVASVLRSSRLSDIAKQIVLRLVACGGSFGVRGIVEGWVSSKARGSAILALGRLEAMAILESSLGLTKRSGSDVLGEDWDGKAMEEEGRMMDKDATLTSEFGNSMKIFLSTSPSSPWPIITTEQIDAHKLSCADGEGNEKPSRDPPTSRELEAYTQSSWDSVLHFLVGSDDADRNEGNYIDGDNGSKLRDAMTPTIEEPSDAMVQFLTRIGLMQEDPDYTGNDRTRAPLVITSKGYEFMLRDINAQVWQFVLQYMNSLSQLQEMRDAIRIEALSFLICLGSTRIGEGYHISVLGKSKEARQVMKDFGRFGIVFVCRVAGKVAFYPTRLAVNLIASNEKATTMIGGGGDTVEDLIGGGVGGGMVGGQSVAATRSLEEALASPVPSRSHLAVVVQTNFQVVAYTRSKLHISTLGLFCDVQSYRRLPNVIFFHLSRDSVRGAFRLGVTADQILRFLHVHAHPMLRSEGRALVPANVRDQIMLWDRERRRVVMDEVCVHQCRDAAEFAAVGRYAKDTHGLAWGAANTNKLYIHHSKNNQVQAYIQRWRTRQIGK